MGHSVPLATIKREKMTTELTKTESAPKKEESSKVTAAAKIKTKLEALIKKDTKMVKGMFKNHEIQGGNVKFFFKKYKEVPVGNYDFTDGEVYTIPYMDAEHINTNCAYPVHEYYRNDENKTQSRIGSKIQRFSFVPLDFVSEDIEPSRIITVERV